MVPFLLVQIAAFAAHRRELKFSRANRALQANLPFQKQCRAVKRPSESPSKLRAGDQSSFSSPHNWHRVDRRDSLRTTVECQHLTIRREHGIVVARKVRRRESASRERIEREQVHGSRLIAGWAVGERQQLSIGRPRKTTEIPEDLIEITALPMGFAYLPFGTAQGRNHINTGVTLLNTAECNVMSVG
jgi:hypothetical protein